MGLFQRKKQVFLLGCVLAFLSGGLLTQAHLFPYGWIERAFSAQTAFRKQGTFRSFARKIQQLTPLKEPAVRERLPGAQDGATLYTLGGKTAAILVDMDGKELHRWNFSLESHAINRDHLPHWRNAHAYPNGDLLVVTENMAVTPYAQPLSRYNKDGKLLWQSTQGAHHGASVLPNGDILTLCQTLADKDAYDLRGTKLQIGPEGFLDDAVCVFDENGKQKKSVSLMKMLLAGKYGKLLSQNGNAWDPIHANSAMLLDADMAQHFPQFRAGQVLVSLRNSSVILVADLEEERVVWAAHGPWKLQHDASFMADGRILLFDNQGKRGQSRILGYDMETQTATPIYGGSRQQAFSSPSLGSVVALRGGNLLVVSSMQGRVFEVTPEGRRVWDFTAPYAYSDGERVIVTSAHRYEEGYFTVKPGDAP